MKKIIIGKTVFSVKKGNGKSWIVETNNKTFNVSAERKIKSYEKAAFYIYINENWR